MLQYEQTREKLLEAVEELYQHIADQTKAQEEVECLKQALVKAKEARQWLHEAETIADALEDRAVVL